MKPKPVFVGTMPDLLNALRAMTDRYVNMVQSGDCGSWDPEQDQEVIQARQAIANAEKVLDSMSQ